MNLSLTDNKQEGGVCGGGTVRQVSVYIQHVVSEGV